MHSRLKVLGQGHAFPVGPVDAAPPSAVVFDRGDHALLLGTQNLVVVRGDAATLQEAASTLARARPGRLTADVRAIHRAVREAPTAASFSDDTPEVTQLNIGNTTRCNMACSYCYQELPGRPGGKARALDMDVETARAMVTALLESGKASGGVVLVFIGGESLLQRQLLAELLAWARVRGDAAGVDVGCVLYTNGALMDGEVVAWANREDVSLVVSLDGPPEMHDRNRVFLSGKGSSKVVLRNIRTLVDHSEHPLLRVRSVSTERGLLLPLHRYLFDLGFNELYVQAAYGEEGYQGSVDAQDVERLAAWYRELLLAGVVFGVHPFTAILERLHRRGGAVTSHHPCNAGLAALGVDANGDLYPCHHFYGLEEHRLGNVKDGLPSADERRRLFAPVTHRDPCAGCWNQRLCGGECYHRALTMDRGYFGVVTESCEQKKAFSVAALDLFTAVRERRPDVIGQLLRKEYTRPVVNPAAYGFRTLDPYR